MELLNRSRDRARAGLTLIEVVVAATVFALIMSSVGLVSLTSYNAVRSTTLRASVESDVRRAVDRVASEVMALGAIDVATDPTLAGGASRLDFTPITGVVAGAVVWGNPVRLDLQYEAGELDDGIDNNGNGLVDEGVLSLIRDVGGANPTSVVLCRNVSEFAPGEIPNGADDNGNGVVDERGFNLHQVGRELRIRLTLGEPLDGQVVTRTIETTVKLRNMGI